MILKACFLLVLSVAWEVSGASFSKVFVQTGPEVAPASDYFQYGAPSYVYGSPQIAEYNAAPVGFEYPRYSIATPCPAGGCFYAGQTVAAVEQIAPSTNVFDYKSQLSSLPVVYSPVQSAPTGYEYSYVIVDQRSGDHKVHSELSDGDVVRGEYSFLQPDGLVRAVQYVADDNQGFNAIVENFAPGEKVVHTEIAHHIVPCHDGKSGALTAHESHHDAHGEQHESHEQHAGHEAPESRHGIHEHHESQEDHKVEEHHVDHESRHGSHESHSAHEGHKVDDHEPSKNDHGHHSSQENEEHEARHGNHELHSSHEEHDVETHHGNHDALKKHHSSLEENDDDIEVQDDEHHKHSENNESHSHASVEDNESSNPEEESSVSENHHPHQHISQDITHEKLMEISHIESHQPHEGHHVIHEVQTSHEPNAAGSNIYVSYDDIIKCIQAAITKVNTHPSLPRPPSPLTYLVFNKPC